MTDYYEILGVPRDATQDQIKKAYRKLARELHPDVAGEEGADRFKDVTRAYEVLGTAEKRQVQNMVAKVLGLEQIPKPADAADALAIAICHAWRAPLVATDAGSSPLTPAQQAWRAAEKAAGASGVHHIAADAAHGLNRLGR